MEKEQLAKRLLRLAKEVVGGDAKGRMEVKTNGVNGYLNYIVQQSLGSTKITGSVSYRDETYRVSLGVVPSDRLGKWILSRGTVNIWNEKTKEKATKSVSKKIVSVIIEEWNKEASKKNYAIDDWEDWLNG